MDRLIEKTGNPNKTICLCMIVKNESQVIKDTLENLCSKIKFSYWVISDTGSTDDTKEIIIDFFKSKNIPGELVEHEWKDFGENRTKSLEVAYNKSDYVLIFDADDRLCGDFKLPNPMICDRYNLIIGKGFVYTRSLLVSNRIRWRFVGVLHEYLECIEKEKLEQTIYGDYYVESNRCGYRSKNPNKYLDDAKILEKAFEKEIEKPEKSLAYRYAFYCAQSYRDCGKKTESIKWYEKILTLGNWNQEKYFSCIMLGKFYKELGNFAKSLEFFLKSEEYDSERSEGIILASELLRINKHHILTILLYKKYKNYNKNPIAKLFLLKDHYDDHKFELNTFISACEVGDFTTAYECAKVIITHCKVQDVIKNVLSKFHLCKDIIKTDPQSLDLFNKVDQIIYELRNDQETKDPNNEMFICWNVLHDTCKKTLTQVKEFRFKNKRSPTVFISFTTCKRYDLFEQTIRSILNQWTDLNKIDYWFCVDDNSSANHRAKMTRNFPWIDYCFKPENEKGHLSSMNIIYKKLSELKPKYWIHMEDDFLFHYKTNYVGKSINAIELLRKDGVRQILFNVNYAETIEDYRIKGGLGVIERDDDDLKIEIHDYKEGTFHYSNCHYWPNYSFRPSLTSVDEILEIGDFTSNETFFEAEYARRYTDKGYKSAFFDRITNKHIGRLTSERFDKNKLNAYQLNEVEQFVNKPEHTEEIEYKVEETGIETIPIPIKIINLEKRPDRMENTTNEFARHGIKSSNLEFIKAVDGSILNPTMEIYNLFKNNDFGGRKGFIGCALSHYRLWKKLLNDKENDYYLIFEDDIKLSPDFASKMVSLKDKYTQCDFLFLGYHMFERERNQVRHIYDIEEPETLNIAKLEQGIYIGGFFAYSISKQGAKKLLDYIKERGIGHGIDYVLKLAHISGDIIASEVRPHIVFSEWYEHVEKPVDTDIQKDITGFDFSHVSEFKHKEIKVKMLCNWCDSKRLCEEWSNMCQNAEGFGWYGKNTKITMVYDDRRDVDYYVIINSTNEYHDPKKTFVFQMEPWVYDETKNWGVKTWGEWSCPSESQFRHVHSHKKYLNNVQWLLKTGLNEISADFKNVSKSDKIASVCSQKNFDEGHVLRNDFIRYLESNSEYINDKMDIFGRENYHDFKTYAGQLRDDDKTNSILPYKYHIAFENNSEHNYATEKIWEPILCETLCFYWGCPNLEDHLDSNAFVRLDVTNFERSKQIIERAVKEDWWSQRIDSIRREKKRILEEIAFFPNLEKLVEKYE